MNRRRFVASAVAGGLAATAGCVGSLLDDLTTYEAVPATVSDAAVSEAGYEHQGTEEDVREEEFASQTVEVTNYMSEYTRSVEIPGVAELDAAVFAVISTPEVSVAGREFNPVDDMENTDIVDMVQDQYEDLSIEESVDSRSIEILGESIEVETFAGSATFTDGTDLDVLVDIPDPFKHEDDFLIPLAVYPEDIPGESENATTMFEGLEHEE